MIYLKRSLQVGSWSRDGTTWIRNYETEWKRAIKPGALQGNHLQQDHLGHELENPDIGQQVSISCRFLRAQASFQCVIQPARGNCLWLLKALMRLSHLSPVEVQYLVFCD